MGRKEADDMPTKVAERGRRCGRTDTTAANEELFATCRTSAGGLIADVWHTEKTETTADELSRIPPGRIVAVELSDAAETAAAETVVGALQEDTLRNRLLRGAGSFDLVGDIRALHTAGWDGPCGIEILPTEFVSPRSTRHSRARPRRGARSSRRPCARERPQETRREREAAARLPDGCPRQARRDLPAR